MSEDTSSAANATSTPTNDVNDESKKNDGDRTPSPVPSLNFDTRNTEYKNHNAIFDSSTDDESSDSSSSDEFTSSSSKSDWKIDLGTFSRTRIKLLTELNRSTKCGLLLQAYFDKQQNAKMPWTEQRADYGIFPLHNFFYRPCATNDPDKLAHEDICIKLGHVAFLGMPLLPTSIEEPGVHYEPATR